MIQKWVGVGRLGRDAEVITYQSGHQGLKFSMAIDDSYLANGQWKERTYWIPVDVNLPSLVQSYTGRLNKGILLWVEGKLCTYSYSDQSGQQRIGFKIEASSMRIIPTGQGGNSNTSGNNGGYQPPQHQPQNSGGYQPPQPVNENQMHENNSQNQTGYQPPQPQQQNGGYQQNNTNSTPPTSGGYNNDGGLLF